eukprot:TRINITY_DN11681_c0_g1_i1.p1 TRINITY_DN11681_c0_g1~~TRINITY_DN11681_c0_g1_i1.p1  ORF type:complete len:1068 (-),score=186.53 TRINITY_DN11681_c0_g1_i1:43-3246(-)
MSNRTKSGRRISMKTFPRDSNPMILDMGSDEGGIPLDNDISSMTFDDSVPEPTGFAKFKASVKNTFFPPKQYFDRTIELRQGRAFVNTEETNLPPNVIRNQKYNPYTFLFVVLYEQFKFFFNMYFLLVALSQFIPQLKIGYLFTYVAPLVFVLAITILKEAYDDFKRWKRDKEANSQKYQKLTPNGPVTIPSSEIRVGDLIFVEKDCRLPADIVVLRTTEKSGASFIRTDQLDGETDWKLRRAVASTQELPSDESLLSNQIDVFADRPKMDIYSFVGTCTVYKNENKNLVSLSDENTMWMNTVVASGIVIGLVIYTGSETRSSMNTSHPKTKVGLLDMELNRLSKVLFGLMSLLSLLMVALNGFRSGWLVDFFRYMLLFSAIIPISLRVNLDIAKTLYSYWIMNDDEIEGTIVRTSTIPEELGRISYLLSDKTGTLTQNEMIFKKLHLGSYSFNTETLDELEIYLEEAFTDEYESSGVMRKNRKRSIHYQVQRTVEALALCHNVTPTFEEGSDIITYQASSPDEVALVKFTESIGLTLWHRDLHSMTLKTPLGNEVQYSILNVFPFSSETKRMGIIIRNEINGEIMFYMKGADVVMSRIVQSNDWLDEECGNMAREGLRTLVFGMKVLSEEEYGDFHDRYLEAKATVIDRDQNVQDVVESIEHNLQLIGLSGVEDKLQENVKPTLEMLRNAGIKIWMLTGDKIETATCIAISARLVSRNQDIYTLSASDPNVAIHKLDRFRVLKDTALIIDGKTLQLFFNYFPQEFISSACQAPAVVCCRCSPTQKAEIVTLLKNFTKKQTAAIGDGGNDVSMIQAADVGIGIVGKEGKQASLAADFSINQFSFVSRLMIWHGRNSYKRSASLGQFVIHRGLIISFIQAIFSSLFYFAAITIYTGWLLVGYATIYTTAPVFSLVLDVDVTEDIAFQFPELYRELQKGRSLSYKTFFIWVFKSIYQASVIMLMSIFLFDNSMINIVSITFTALILTELFNVAFEIHKWHVLVVISEVVTLGLYFVSMVILKSYFDLSFILTTNFVWKTSLIVAMGCLPVLIWKIIKSKYYPPAYAKLT